MTFENYKHKHMKRSYQIIFLLIALFFASCQSADEKHFISDPDYRKEVKEAFEQTKLKADGRAAQLFSIFKENLSTEEKEALQFLYAYMPLSDLSNYDGTFFLKNVRAAFAARDTFSWGTSIPEDVFRHFVLPYRTNNEDMDSARQVFLKELYPRIKDMDMESAALEVNHWCHEKVNYKATDSRTMAPLGVIKTAYGRCGEESTFTVTALRSVGIPARQVYTPRWAHTDDNHAWVETYINGEWKFLGACEPAPALNMGWFDAAVLRAMMVHTKVFGKYKGSEAVIRQKKYFSELNLLSNYVEVKDLCVQVTDTEGKPLKDAYVEFGLYNYAEFYPLKRGLTQENGCISLTTGKGTLRITASKDDAFAIKEVQVAQTDTLKLRLNKKQGEIFSETLDYTPPPSQIPATADIDDTQNKKRLQEEDKMREAYIATFYNAEKAEKYAASLGLNADILKRIMPEARGNYAQIEQYLEATKDLKHKKQLSLLEVIQPKDLHDIDADILTAHLREFETRQDYPEEITNKYILNPRIELEKISPYRAFLKKQFADIVSDDIEKTVDLLKQWITKNITIDKERNYYRLIALPQGVYEIKHADKLSRKVFFVAVMRSLGYPARIEEANRKIQYWNKQWKDVKFEEKAEKKTGEQSYVNFKTAGKTDLQYRVHFALAKFIDNRFRTVELGWDKKLSEFDKNTIIEPGYYQLITGNRLQGGNVLVQESFFNVAPKETKNIQLSLRDKKDFYGPITKINRQLLGQENSKKLQVFAWITPSSEPGKHFIAEYKTLEKEFAKEQIPLQFFTKDKKDKDLLQKALSKDIDITEDKDFKIIQKIAAQSTTIEQNRYPVFMLANEKGEVLYLSQGYNIGIPEQILKVWKHYIPHYSPSNLFRSASTSK